MSRAGRGYSGKYKKGDRVTTRVNNWTAGVSKEKKTPFIRVNLEGGITWTGWCSSDKAKEITIKALHVMGFKGTDLSQIKLADALDTERDVVAVIGEVRKWQDKTYYDASFINRAAKKGFQADEKDNSVFDTLKDIDTRAHIEDAQDLSADETDKKDDYNPVYDQTFTADDIPF
jgi:hypothetical protein